MTWLGQHPQPRYALTGQALWYFIYAPRRGRNRNGV